jgi:hypothetical protein
LKTFLKYLDSMELEIKIEEKKKVNIWVVKNMYSLIKDT